MPKTVSIFGATGSIGTSALRVIERNPSYKIDTLTAGQNWLQLVELAQKFKPQTVVIGNPDLKDKVKDALAGASVEVLAGPEGLKQAAEHPIDIFLSAIVGFAGVEPSLIAARNVSRLALANKETLVCAGALLNSFIQQSGCELIPVDSEHSAIFQSIMGQSQNAIEHITITASGGPFRHMSLSQMEHVTPEQAQKHPNWDMGLRISIDSASMFNKGMELIETKELFDLRPHQISAVTHPQSIVHSIVGFQDGAAIAHISMPDMEGPIAFALTYPERAELDLPRLDLTKALSLEFEPIDREKFPAIDLAFEVMEKGGQLGTVYNAAKEAALDHFLTGHITFTQMAAKVRLALYQFENACDMTSASFAQIKALNDDTRSFVDQSI